MRIVPEPGDDALYIGFGEERPHRVRLIDEGTVADLGSEGELLGLTVVCPHRDWSRQLEQVLAVGPISDADAQQLRDLTQEGR